MRLLKQHSRLHDLVFFTLEAWDRFKRELRRIPRHMLNPDLPTISMTVRTSTVRPLKPLTPNSRNNPKCYTRNSNPKTLNPKNIESFEEPQVSCAQSGRRWGQAGGEILKEREPTLRNGLHKCSPGKYWYGLRIQGLRFRVSGFGIWMGEAECQHT